MQHALPGPVVSRSSVVNIRHSVAVHSRHSAATRPRDRSGWRHFRSPGATKTWRCIARVAVTHDLTSFWHWQTVAMPTSQHYMTFTLTINTLSLT